MAYIFCFFYYTTKIRYIFISYKYLRIYFYIFNKKPLRGSRNGKQRQGSTLPFQITGSHSVLFTKFISGAKRNGSPPDRNGTRKAAPKGCFLTPYIDYSEINCISISEIFVLIRPRMKPINSTNTKRFDKAKISPLPHPARKFQFIIWRVESIFFAQLRFGCIQIVQSGPYTSSSSTSTALVRPFMSVAAGISFKFFEVAKRQFTPFRQLPPYNPHQSQHPWSSWSSSDTPTDRTKRY